MTDRKAEAAEAAHVLTAALDRMSAQLEAVRDASEQRDEALAEYGRRNRHLIYWTIASVVFDIALSVVIAVFAIQAHHASTTATAASTRVAHVSASNYALCQSGNVGRAQQIQLWSFVISLPSSHKQTAQQRHNVAAFETRLHRIFAPRNCAALGKKTH